MDLGFLIKKARKAAGLTQAQLAKKLGLATGTIQQYELGKRKPTLDAMLKIADALDVDIFGLIPSSHGPQNFFFDDDFSRVAMETITDLKRSFEAMRADTIEKYDTLNATGQKKAHDYVTDLSEQKKYVGGNLEVTTEEDD